MCALFVPLQVSPLSAARLASLVDESLSKEETNLESDKEEKSLPKDCLISNNPIMQPDRCEAGTAEDKPQRLKGGDLLNQPKLRKCENVEAGEIVKCSKRVALLHYCENDARVDLSRSAYIEGPSQMRVIRSRSAGSKPQERNCKEKPGRFEMLI